MDVGFFLHVEPKDDHVSVPHDVVLALGTDEALVLAGLHGAVRDQVVVGDHLRPDEAPLEVRVDLSGGLGSLVPFWMVQARTSLGPAVRKLMRPKRS